MNKASLNSTGLSDSEAAIYLIINFWTRFHLNIIFSVLVLIKLPSAEQQRFSRREGERKLRVESFCCIN